MKRNTICGAYSDYTPENGTMGGTYNTRNVPARDTRHFAVPKVENNSEKAHVEYVRSQMPFMANHPNFMHTNIFRYMVIDCTCKDYAYNMYIVATVIQ